VDQSPECVQARKYDAAPEPSSNPLGLLGVYFIHGVDSDLPFANPF
jgi:hypothetical protein